MAAGQTFEVALGSLNLHGGRTPLGQTYSVADAIGSMETDVVVVQENWRPEGTDSIAREAAKKCRYGEVLELDLLGETTLYDLGVVDRLTASERGSWGLAVLSRLPVVGQSIVTLGSAAGDMGPRAALVVDLGGNGRPILRVVNTHLTHRAIHGPGQLRRLLMAVRAEYPVVIVGDLNMCRPMIYLARPYRPVVRGRTWPARSPVAQLDHVLAGAGIRTAIGTVMPPVGSDHLPIRANLIIDTDRPGRG